MHVLIVRAAASGSLTGMAVYVDGHARVVLPDSRNTRSHCAGDRPVLQQRHRVQLGELRCEEQRCTPSPYHRP